MPEFEVTCERCDDDTSCATVKLSSAIVEINIWFTDAEALKISEIHGLMADAPGLPLGCSAKQQVYWARDADNRFYLLVGEGDTTWDIGLTLSASTVRRIIQAVTNCRQ